MLDKLIDKTYKYVPYALNVCMVIAACMDMVAFTVVFAALYIKWKV